jgi:hypothetical protein
VSDSFNLGRGRRLPPKPVFHESVRTYRERNERYTPKAKYQHGTELYEPELECLHAEWSSNLLYLASNRDRLAVGYIDCSFGHLLLPVLVTIF